jgi:hypothetical protein
LRELKRGHLEEMDVDGRNEGKVVGCCQRGNEPAIKCEEFNDWLRNCQLLKKDTAVWS